MTLIIGFVYTILTNVLLLTFSEPLMRLFSQDAALIAYGVRAMHFFCLFYWLLSILHALSGVVRGTGKSLLPTVVLLVALCAFRVAWVQWMMLSLGTIEGIFILYPLSWVLGSCLMMIYTWKGIG